MAGRHAAPRVHRHRLALVTATTSAAAGAFVAVAGTASAGVPLVLVPASPAELPLPPVLPLLPGLTGAPPSSSMPPLPQLSMGERVVLEAARHAGAPYRWGAAGPNAFDCSGLTMFVYGRVGVPLPHNSQAQYDASTHVLRSDMQLGDLLFFGRSRAIHHVAIYAGDGRMWTAPEHGQVVKLAPIYDSSFLVGRPY